MSNIRITDVYPNRKILNSVQTTPDGFKCDLLNTGLEAVTTAGIMQASGKTVSEMLVLELFGFRIHYPKFTDSGQRIWFSVATIPSGAVLEPSNYGYLCRKELWYTLVNSGSDQFDNSLDISMTNGGLGYLVASPNMYVAWDTENFDEVQDLYIEVFYRYVRIPYFEFWQLQQSQADVNRVT